MHFCTSQCNPTTKGRQHLRGHLLRAEHAVLSCLAAAPGDEHLDGPCGHQVLDVPAERTLVVARLGGYVP